MDTLNGKITKHGYTFDDVLLVPAYSQVVPAKVKLYTQLTPKIKLNIPICAAAMDTVCEEKMALALAKLGGIGFIHKNMTIEDQALMITNMTKVVILLGRRLEYQNRHLKE